MEYLSSDIDWCEDNFVYSNYIAEFFNTISNIPFIGFYYLGIYTFKNLNCYGDDKFLYGCLLFTGVSSFYFHATLSLFSQLIDEFSIIFLLANTLIMIYKDYYIRLAIKSYTFAHSIVMCYYPQINIPVLFIIGFCVWKILKEKMIHVESLESEFKWLDTGTFKSLIEASKFIKSIEKSKGFKVGCLEEIAFKKGYISKDELLKQAENLKTSSYGVYLINKFIKH